ncbi:MAG TPA: hydrogenase expression/formation protein HypE [Desulfobulbaceae bacterium]|nr:hydrogenase expression/formation protein HypE [Desulfobulbaceae bacterium]
MSTKRILLDHGSGGVASRELIETIFLPRLDNPILSRFEDSAVLPASAGRLAFTTDSYVVDPIFFPGGDIGKLAVNGTINDLAMQGATPIGLSLALILEEGFPLADLERLADSIGDAARSSGVPVVTGDTKVVHRGKADKIFITTAGVGMVADGLELSSRLARPGDAVLLSGFFGDHGITIIATRSGLAIQSDIQSDTAPLHNMVAAMLARKENSIRCLRDPTRGGIATVLAEIAEKSQVQINISEEALPLRPGVSTACELLGLDPLYLANEGKCIVIADSASAQDLLAIMRATPEGRDAALIGRVAPLDAGVRKGRVVLRTAIGGTRLIGSLSGEPLPRIC